MYWIVTCREIVSYTVELELFWLFLNRITKRLRDGIMLITTTYHRERAREYARRWAFERNPIFYDFAGIGGDCTSFVSQCVYAGCCETNYNVINGWYYSNLENRSPSWSGVSFFYDFIVTNKGNGPFGMETDENGLEVGDVIQLQNPQGRFYHTLLVTGFEDNTYLVSAHTDDAFDRRLDSYRYAGIRFLHILGVREYEKNKESCFYNFYNGISLNG